MTVTMTSTTVLGALAGALLVRIAGDEPNPLIGIRTKATMASPAAWRVAHNTARPTIAVMIWVAVAGLCAQLAVGVAAGFDSAPSSVASTVVCAVVYVILIGAAIRGHRAAKAVA